MIERGLIEDDEEQWFIKINGFVISGYGKDGKQYIEQLIEKGLKYSNLEHDKEELIAELKQLKVEMTYKQITRKFGEEGNNHNSSLIKR